MVQKKVRLSPDQKQSLENLRRPSFSHHSAAIDDFREGSQELDWQDTASYSSDSERYNHNSRAASLELGRHDSGKRLSDIEVDGLEVYGDYEDGMKFAEDNLEDNQPDGESNNHDVLTLGEDHSSTLDEVDTIGIPGRLAYSCGVGGVELAVVAQVSTKPLTLSKQVADLSQQVHSPSVPHATVSGLEYLNPSMRQPRSSETEALKSSVANPCLSTPVSHGAVLQAEPLISRAISGLEPGKWLNNDVLTMIISTFQASRSDHWHTCDPGGLPFDNTKAMLEGQRRILGGLREHHEKILIPCFQHNHWSILVVDLCQSVFLYYNSFASKEYESEARAVTTILLQELRRCYPDLQDLKAATWPMRVQV